MNQLRTNAIYPEFRSKGPSPFYPDQPVPVELFRGRTPQIEHILQRGVAQVAAGKPVTMFVEGEYGIGKSSIAAFTQWQAEMKYGLHGVYVTLGGARGLEDVAEQILSATVRSGAFNPTRGEKIRNWLAKYLGEQQLFGLSLNLAALKQDAPTFQSVGNLLQFLGETIFRLKDTGVRGIFLILDEINGITGEPGFVHFLKGLVDTNALSRPPIPLLLMLCGVEERRRELVQRHEPVGRIFDIVKIERMTDEEMRDFYSTSFANVNMRVDDNAMAVLIQFAAGFPKIMHLIGNAAYWLDEDGRIDEKDAQAAVVAAADEVGRKYVTQQVYAALRSRDYHSILAKIATINPYATSFTKAEVEAGLTQSEKGKFNNFIQRMKRLKVIRSGENRGEYVFNVRMVHLYIYLQSIQKTKV
jgi:hypothetical protein